MKIPKKVVKDNREYAFVEVIKNNMYLYENVKTKARTTFSNYDLGLIDNTKIDKIINIDQKRGEPVKVVVYDRLMEEEKEYETIKLASEELGVHSSTIIDKINSKSWLDNRWFIERIE